MCFNPHTHEGCDVSFTDFAGENEVSIHTPTKGVTNTAANQRKRWEVSIHTPTKGVTGG